MPKKASAPPPEDDLRLEYMPLHDLTRWPGNPKQHAEDVIAASIERFGFRDPIAIDEASQRIVSGHGRLSVLEQAFQEGREPPRYIKLGDDGMWLVPVTRGGTFDDEAEAAAYLIAVNKSVEIGGWDDAALAELISTMDADLRGYTGFDQAELNALVDSMQAQSGPGDFLSDLLTPPTGPDTRPAPPAPAADAPEEQYFQVVYVLRREERDEALNAVKDARSRFSLETLPQAFLHIVRHYVTTVQEAQP